jgi:transketolase
MIKNLHLNDFTDTVGSSSIPKYYGEALVALAKEDSRVVTLTGDLAPATESDLFREAFPSRFFTSGIAEANMIGLAAGMARCGDMPFVHSFSVFLTRRAYDQIAMQIAYPQLNVKLAGFLPGLTTLLGVSHQAIDDLALMRVLPNMTIIEPSSGKQIAAAVRAAAQIEGPVYLRLHKDKTVINNAEVEQNLEVGKGQLLLDGDDAVIFASGYMVAEALAAADLLFKSGIKVSVANMHTLKPFDTNFVLEHAIRTGVVVTAENHSVIGGIGSAVAEVLAEDSSGASIKFKRIGIADTFAEGGTTNYLFNKYGLSANHVSDAVLKLLNVGS